MYHWRRRARALVAAATVLLGACIPYSVGSTAEPVAPGQVVSSGSLYFVPAAVELRVDSTRRSTSYMAADAEVRYGLDDRSDIGLRIPGTSGLVGTYQRRLSGSARTRAVTAVRVGAGLVNLGNHALIEATFLASGRERAVVTPYGGVRAMHVLPLNSLAVSDEPTIGLFAGARIGTRERGFSPEIGVFHDPPALGLRSSRLIVVPSITVHGSDLLRGLRGLRGPRGLARWR